MCFFGCVFFGSIYLKVLIQIVQLNWETLKEHSFGGGRSN